MEKAHGWVTSVDAGTGKVKWKDDISAPVIGGVTPTAGGVTFAGDIKGNLFALDSATGKQLFTTLTSGMIAGGIATYEVGGKQYVAVTSGNVSRLTFGLLGDPTVIVMAVADRPKAPSARLTASKGEEPALSPGASATSGAPGPFLSSHRRSRRAACFVPACRLPVSARPFRRPRRSERRSGVQAQLRDLPFDGTGA